MTGGRPRLLFLSQTLPYPPDGGVKVRTYNILRLLARSFDVTALCFFRAQPGVDERAVVGAVRGLRRFAAVQAFPIPQEHSRVRLAWDHVRSLVTRRVYTVQAYRSPAFDAALDAVLGTNSFDLVHADSLDLSRYFPRLDGLPLVCTHHDATSVQLARRAGKERHPLRRWYVGHQAELMRREEANWCERVALNVTVSDQDLATLREIAPHGRFAVVPNGVDTDFFHERVGPEQGLVCVGGLGWFPNRDALEFYARAILPHLGGAEAAHLRWVGRAVPEQQREFRRRYGIEVTGYVDDVRPYVWDAACFVVPIRVGGGTRVKILDAWAMGKAVVSTSIGCEGLEAVDGENILVRDEPREFALAVQHVLADEGLRSRLGRGARSTVERKYSWEVIGRSMIERYYSLLSTVHPDRDPGVVITSGSPERG